MFGGLLSVKVEKDLIITHCAPGAKMESRPIIQTIICATKSDLMTDIEIPSLHITKHMYSTPATIKNPW